MSIISEAEEVRNGLRMRIAVIIGTRPEIIKMAPVIRGLGNREADYFILHTGQHYSYTLDRIFFEQLKLPHPEHNLEVGSGSHAQQTARILTGVEDVLQKENPWLVLVEGDTNSVLAAALAASKLNITIGHVEAGLRSYDRSMPEETNRILTDHCSDYLFAPTNKAQSILLGEGIPADKIYMTGNTIVDAVRQNLELAREQEVATDKLGLQPKGFFLVTVHRQENVDDRERLGGIIEGLNRISGEYGFPVVYPVHPRARKMLGEFSLDTRNITLIEPVDFLSFLRLEDRARLVLTDSGGVQEESCIMGIPCVTLRYNTERPETVETGANLLAGADTEKIVECVDTMLGKNGEWENPFGDGKAGKRIADIVMEESNG